VLARRVYPPCFESLADINRQASTDELDNDSQKRARFAQPTHLPSPDTRIASNSNESNLTASSGVSEKRESSPSAAAGLHSPPSDTQPYSQFLPPPPISYEVEDEEAEGVWGYLVPLDGVSEPLVLRRRAACPVPQTKVGRTDGKSAVSRDEYLKQEESYEEEKAEKGIPAGGYLIGRHPECGQYNSSSTQGARLTATDQIV
jgi:serine/threonine-protein kinase Chk2